MFADVYTLRITIHSQGIIDMTIHDSTGRAYVKLSELQEGSYIRLDDGFTCTSGLYMVCLDVFGLYILCAEGRRYLDGQADQFGNLIGMYKEEELHGSVPT